MSWTWEPGNLWGFRYPGWPMWRHHEPINKLANGSIIARGWYLVEVVEVKYSRGCWGIPRKHPCEAKKKIHYPSSLENKCCPCLFRIT